MKRLCLQCKIELVGRRDKKFCSDYCRNTYNNQLNSDSSNLMRRINNILRKNRRILAKLNRSGKTKITKNKLVDEGFNFQYFTNTYTTKGGKIYHFCYDQGYINLESEYYMLVERQDYV